MKIMEMERKNHWDQVYETKNPEEVSWTQEVPKTSLNLIKSFNLPKSAGIIDVGGGDSKLVDHLLEEGYENITVLDISVKAIEKAKRRLGGKAEKVNWVVSDIIDFKPNVIYDIWHDRATFHFLTIDEQISKYVEVVNRSVEGFLIIGTFSEQGPKKCSGLDVQQYNERSLVGKFDEDFEVISSLNEDHKTPFDTKQNFLFCSFKRR